MAEAAGRTDLSRSVSRIKQCSRCGRSAAGLDAVPFWDGLTYCQRCVEKVSPGLAMDAHRHPTFRETVPKDLASHDEYLRIKYVRLPLQMVGVTLGLFLWMSLMAETNLMLPGCVLIAFALFIYYVKGIGIEGLMGLSEFNSRLPRTVKVRRGYLFVDAPWCRQVYRLSECRWFPGSTSLTSDMHVMPGRSVIVIETPLRSRDPYTRISDHKFQDLRLAVGFTPLARERWLGLLTLSGCERRRPAPTVWSESLLLLILGTAGLGSLLVLRLLGF